MNGKKAMFLLVFILCAGALVPSGQDMGLSVHAGASPGSWMGDAAPDPDLLYGGSARASLSSFLRAYVDIYLENPAYDTTTINSATGMVLAASICDTYPLIYNADGIMRLGGGISQDTRTIDIDCKYQTDQTLTGETSGFCVTFDYDFYGSSATITYIVSMDNPDLSLSFYLRLL